MADTIKELSSLVKDGMPYDSFVEATLNLGLKTVTITKINNVEIHRVERKFRDVLEVFVELEAPVVDNSVFLSNATIRKAY